MSAGRKGLRGGVLGSQKDGSKWEGEFFWVRWVPASRGRGWVWRGGVLRPRPGSGKGKEGSSGTENGRNATDFEGLFGIKTGGQGS